MALTISPQQVAGLLGSEFLDAASMYAGLSSSLRILIGDGRIPLHTRLPSERALATALGVSRTTITKAYEQLVAEGFAQAKVGSGTTTRLPLDMRRLADRALVPRGADEALINLNCAADSAPPGIAEAYSAAVDRLPAYLSNHGYYPAGLPELQIAIAATYDARGLPTDPAQILITPGALTAGAIVAHALTGAGSRVLVENPVYPNATKALAHRGAELISAPVHPHGWDLELYAALVRESQPQVAYLIPDFQNPTGLVMSAAERERHAWILERHSVIPVVDEAHHDLALDGQPMPRPYAAWAAQAISLGSASKSHWGGLRLGWIRAPHSLVSALTNARLSLDLGAPVLEQLALLHLLQHPEPTYSSHRQRLRTQRDALVAALGEHVPTWSFRQPSGGLALWCRLPRPNASQLVDAAERGGVVISPGSVFAVNGGLEQFVRIPWTRPAEELRAAVAVLARAYESLEGASAIQPRQRITVA